MRAKRCPSQPPQAQQVPTAQGARACSLAMASYLCLQGTAALCPCQALQCLPSWLPGGTAAWQACRPTASQADVMANSRHLAHSRDF